MSMVWDKSKPLILMLIMVFVAFHSNATFAQKTGETNPYDTRQTVGTILLTGLAGGVLGLSTLSFYDEPQNHIRNITFGAGLGMIAAALYLTASVAQTPPPQAKDWNIYPSIDPRGSYGFAMNLNF